MKKIFLLTVLVVSTHGVAMDTSAEQKKETNNNCDMCLIANTSDIVEMNSIQYLFRNEFEASYDHRGEVIFRPVVIIAPVAHELLSKKQQEDFVRTAESIFLTKTKYALYAYKTMSLFQYAWHTQAEFSGAIEE